MDKMGYGGKGLGKKENGIIEPVEIKRKSSFVGNKNVSQNERKLVCILSDSMLNRINRERLSNEKGVAIICHSGCKIKGMYKHLQSAFDLKPHYILLHIGTNDSTTKTSDEILRELDKLKKYIEIAMPDCHVIFSLPIVRSDNTTANQILKNLNMKLKKMNYGLLDNSNISALDLGTKGLHLNDDGNRKIAGNLICLIKRL